MRSEGCDRARALAVKAETQVRGLAQVTPFSAAEPGSESTSSESQSQRPVFSQGPPHSPHSLNELARFPLQSGTLVMV